MIVNSVNWQSVQKNRFAMYNSSLTNFNLNFMVTPCINNIQHFNNQLTHTTLKM